MRLKFCDSATYIRDFYLRDDRSKVPANRKFLAALFKSLSYIAYSNDINDVIRTLDSVIKVRGKKYSARVGNFELVFKQESENSVKILELRPR